MCMCCSCNIITADFLIYHKFIGTLIKMSKILHTVILKVSGRVIRAGYEQMVDLRSVCKPC